MMLGAGIDKWSAGSLMMLGAGMDDNHNTRLALLLATQSMEVGSKSKLLRTAPKRHAYQMVIILICK